MTYASCDSISETLDFDFKQEKQFSYEGLSTEDAMRHIALFTAGIWQIHPFGEGNTRATAVFIIKYLKTSGFMISNDVFADNSWYFRNALVRANYNDLKRDIHATTAYLERFFENLILDRHYELKNRTMHVDYDDAVNRQDKSISIPQMYQIDTLSDTFKLSLPEPAVFNLIAKDTGITQEQLSKKNRTVYRNGEKKSCRFAGKRAYPPRERQTQRGMGSTCRF